MATKSFTNDVTFEPKDVDNLIKALETDKKPNPIKSIKVKTITEPSEILKLVGLKRDEVYKDFFTKSFKTNKRHERDKRKLWKVIEKATEKIKF